MRVEPGVQPTVRLGIVRRLRLAARIGLQALRVAWALRHRRLPVVVARLDRPDPPSWPDDARRPDHSRRADDSRPVDARRLGRLVHRVLNLGPLHARCLTASLVLFHELRRQGTPAELVIGLPAEPTDHVAHAWVEVGGEVVGPPPGRLGHEEMARYSSRKPDGEAAEIAQADVGPGSSEATESSAKRSSRSTSDAR